MKQWIRKISKTALLLAATFFFFNGMASAHVTVNPKASTPGGWETYTIKIPVEKNVPTTKVVLKIPAGVEFESYQPDPNWNIKTEKDSSGKVNTVTWEAKGNGILPGQFEQFQFIAKNPDKETKVAWNAYQYYKDGSIVEWTGAENTDTPHSVTEITASPQKTVQSDEQGHDHDSPVTSLSDEKKQTDHNGSSAETVSVVLSIAAVVLSLIALIVASRKKRS
ncbi:YcnI family protein [Bacillus smithii]|uniref:YcnI family copper-binding membrane protein n=1 Tax=Bacillus smithii TaxID=1479 RepID=UPI002E1F4A31|nr:DUF1775 domain-containing protein [Bacillus smithii]